MKFLRKALIVLLSVLIALVCALAFEQLSRLYARQKYAAQETFADVGGYKLHYKSTQLPRV